MCISNKFGDDADQGPYFENHWPRLKLKLINIRFKITYNLSSQFLAAAPHIPEVISKVTFHFYGNSRS